MIISIAVQEGNMPQYGIKHMTGQKSGDMKSFIIEHVTFVKIRKSHPIREYAPVWHRMWDGSKEKVT